MSTEFLRLYRELEKITPSTAYDEKKLTAQRNDVMYRLGHTQMGGELKYTKCAKFHGKKAREDAHEARQNALMNDAKAKAQKRMQVHNAVHKVEHLNGLARELSSFIKTKQPVPGALMRKLVGNDAMRKKISQPDEGNTDSWKPPTIPRLQREIRKDYTSNAWSIEERMLLNRLYVEIPKPTMLNKVDSWRVFYENVCSRFVALYPNRSIEESIAKLEDMISRRVLKEIGEVEYWESIRSPTKLQSSETSTNSAPSKAQAFGHPMLNESSLLKFGGSTIASSKK